MQVDLGALVRDSPHPMVRHTVAPTSYDAAWVRGQAVVVHGPRHTLVLGPPEDAGALVADLDGTLAPERLTVEAAAAPAVRETWSWQVRGHWHWMLTDAAPPPPDPGGPLVEEVGDPAEVDAVLDAAMPESHARPGAPDIEVWLGVREAGRVVGVGAVRRDPDGSGHLRGVCVLPSATGRGLGRALSAALTRRAADRPPHVATLGVYTDNAPALHLYAALGYRTRHTLLSGPVLPPAPPASPAPQL